jgi:hypothetical protein
VRERYPKVLQTTGTNNSWILNIFSPKNRNCGFFDSETFREPEWTVLKKFKEPCNTGLSLNFEQRR